MEEPLTQLEKNGYECYYVGGCVRNAYLNIKIDDYDLTTSATPDEICNLFSSKKVFIESTELIKT